MFWTLILGGAVLGVATALDDAAGRVRGDRAGLKLALLAFLVLLAVIGADGSSGFVRWLLMPVGAFTVARALATPIVRRIGRARAVP